MTEKLKQQLEKEFQESLNRIEEMYSVIESHSELKEIYDRLEGYESGFMYSCCYPVMGCFRDTGSTEHILSTLINVFLDDMEVFIGKEQSNKPLQKVLPNKPATYREVLSYEETEDILDIKSFHSYLDRKEKIQVKKANVFYSRVDKKFCSKGIAESFKGFKKENLNMLSEEVRKKLGL